MAREYYPLEESPQYTENIEILLNTDPVLAESGSFYGLILRILNNMKALFQLLVPKTRRINGHPLDADVSLDKADLGLENVDNTADADKSVASANTASSAAKLTAARTIALSGGATGTATSFDGSANITIPVTGLDMSKATAGTLPVARGGTGATSLSSITVGKAGSASTLTTARTIAISGGATGTATSFNGSANISIPVTKLDMSKASGTIPAAVKATNSTDYTTSRIRNIRASTTDLTAGSSTLSNGEIYLVYE